MSSELLSSKTIIYEGTPQTRTLLPASTSIAGAIGITERGPIGEPVLCTSFEEYQRQFGKLTANSELGLAAMGFFQNGGSMLWAVRTQHYDDVSDPESSNAERADGNLVATVPGEEGPVTVDAVQAEGKDPGAYGNRVEVEVRPPTSGETGEFNLAILEDGVYRESFINLNMTPDSERYIEAIVNDARTGSVFIRVTDEEEDDVETLDIQTIQLTGGDDGLTGLDDTDFIGSDAGKTGLFALDQVQDISVLLVPGRGTPAVHDAMIQYCDVTRDGLIFPVLDPPQGYSATEIRDYVKTTAALYNKSETGAIYWPWLKIINPSKSIFGAEDTIVVPPSGIVAGVYARTDSAVPGGVYRPPAGVEKGRLFGVVGFETDEVLEEAKRDIVYPARINPLTTSPGNPIYIDGSRTLKGNGQFPYVAEKRGVIYIKRSLKHGLEFARHRNNDARLRAEVYRSIKAFLLIQMHNGAFRYNEPDKAFVIEISDDPLDVMNHQLRGKVLLATNKSTDWVLIEIGQDLRDIGETLA